MQRTEAEKSSRGHITDGLLINYTEGISLYAAGDSKHDKVLDRRVVTRDLPFRKIIPAPARENRLKGVENRNEENH